MRQYINDGKQYIISIDPALSVSGYAVICKDDCDLMYASKIITSPKNYEDDRINDIVKKLFGTAARYNIRDVVLEDGFLGKNPKTSIQLATLRGAIIGTFSYMGYHVAHMLPSEIRKELGVGGNAKKEDVAKKIMEIYGEENILRRIGPYSDKHNKDKTSDIYDAVGTGVAYVRKVKNGNR